VTSYLATPSRPVISPASVANLRAVPSNLFVGGMLCIVPVSAVMTLFSFDTTSMAVDDGATIVKPTDIDIGDPGRWLAVPLGSGPTPVDPFAGLDVESEHRADIGVEFGSTVSRWVDQRSYKHFITFERDLALWYALGPNDEGVMTGTPSGAIRKGIGYTAVFDADGPAIVPPGGLWSRSPLVLDAEEFTLAFRIQLASSNGQSILTICAPFPNGADDCPKLVLRWTYAAGPSGQLELDITDTALNTTTAVVAMTHGAWHNVIVRHIPGVPDPLLDRTLVIRVDGVNGTPQSTATITDDLVPLDATSLGCDLEATNGTSPGFLSGGTAIRHILAAPRSWSDAECLTAEAALTAIWT
jgi:hypothetical protein